MSVTLKSGITSDVQTVGVTSKAAFVEPRDDAGLPLFREPLENLPSNASAMLVAVRNDDHSVMLRADRKGNLITGNYIPELLENFEGATPNALRWLSSVTTFVAAQTTLGGYSFNSTNLTTVSAVNILSSLRLFSKYPRVPLQMKQRLRHSMVIGAIADFGFGVPAGTTLVVPNGTMFRFTNSGAVQGVMTVNGVEIAIDSVVSRVSSNGNTVGTPLNMSNSYYTSNFFVYDIVVDDDGALFTVQDTQTGELIGSLELPVPNNQIKMWGATALPVYNRLYNNTAPSTAPVYVVTEMQVLSMDWNLNPDISQLAGSLGLSAGRQPFTGAQTENHANSAAPASATLSNTTPGYTTLGGKFQFAAVAGAATDFCLFAFQAPAGSRFLCEGVTIHTYNTGAAVATTAHVLEWAIGFNSSAASLATAGYIRRQVGVQHLPVGAAIGQNANSLSLVFETPEVTESGRFLAVIVQIPVGTATALQVIRGQVSVQGRFI